MDEEKRYTRFGFRIKWADREIEYYGDSVSDVFKTVFEHVKSVPVSGVQPTQAPMQIPAEAPTIPETPKPTVPLGAESDRIAREARVSEEQVMSVIEFMKSPEFPNLVPFLPKHPSSQDAVLLVSYALQVGLQKTPIEVSNLKKLLKGPNGYPLPGNEFGLILADFRRTGILIASQTRGQYKPFTLSSKGLGRARKLLKTTEK